MTTNNDTAAILAAIDAAGLEIQELEWKHPIDGSWFNNMALSEFFAYRLYRQRKNAKHSGVTLSIYWKDHMFLKYNLVYDGALVKLIEIANAHNRELVAGMLQVKG